MTAAGADSGPSPDLDRPADKPTVVIRDKRRIDPAGVPLAAAADAVAPPDPPPAASADAPAAVPEGGGEVTIDLDVMPLTDPGGEAPVEAVAAPPAVAPADGDAGAGTSGDGAAAGDQEIDAEGAPVYAELETLRGDLGELTRDLQRVSAEYANYRKRVDRDRLLVSEHATGAVLTALLPVLDDLDRARSHGDLIGPFAAVAEQLAAALQKFGLSPFGETGDPFDPTLHEAVAHMSSPDVTETTCVEVMRRGYMLGDRLLRPALVAVADPQ